MHGTVILVGDDCARSLPAVFGELATAARELSGDGVTLGAVLVSATPDDAALAHRLADAHGFELTVLTPRRADAWSTQQLAFEHTLKQDHPDFVVTLDPRGQHDARQLPDLVRSFVSTGSGVTVGSRWMRGGSAPGTPWARGLLSRAASRLVAAGTGLRRIHDVTTSLRVIRADAADLVGTSPATRSDYGFYCEFIAVAQAFGFTVEEVPIAFRPRFAPVAPLRLADLATFAADLHRIRRRVRAVRDEMHIDQATWAARSGRLRGQSAEVGSEFGALDELSELSGAQRFTRWIVEAIAPALGRQVVEVGAGLGAISRTIAADPTRTVTAIEPAGNVFDQLRADCVGIPNLSVHQLTSAELVERSPGAFDTAVYVNVLEHIRDDVGELRTARQLLGPGGMVAIFVPAMPALYGSLDYKSGHFRRYTSAQLGAALEAAGYVEIDVRSFDMLGVVPYWLMYRVLDIDRLDSVSSTGYDRILVPLSRRLQRFVPRPPFGKNLVATARRPG